MAASYFKCYFQFCFSDFWTNILFSSAQPDTKSAAKQVTDNRTLCILSIYGKCNSKKFKNKIIITPTVSTYENGFEFSRHV